MNDLRAVEAVQRNTLRQAPHVSRSGFFPSVYRLQHACRRHDCVNTSALIRWRAAAIWRTMRRLALRNDAVESRAGGRGERLAGGA